ncbi:HGR030Wp [Eremothecium sinecaudum]|uniref:HGR030Wp n=1 Tax=Eremothecium sinecaudum TaxID=45286 RepID=A0A0X8HVQ2_9SACH|nr:HGR030Wp [Eremothecium sinecaudum]AMD22369.1 HGR030Wp [Eremothecium sinecaudum]
MDSVRLATITEPNRAASLHPTVAFSERTVQKRQVLLPPLPNVHQSSHYLESYLKKALDRGAFDPLGAKRMTGQQNVSRLLNNVMLPQPPVTAFTPLPDSRPPQKELHIPTELTEQQRHCLQQQPQPLEKRRKHHCRTCGRGFTTSGHLARHNRIHTGEKNHTCHFPGCGQRFSRHDNCLQHYRTHLKKNAGGVTGLK